MNRVVFLIDGFNLYHSILDALKRGHATSLKWLDVWALCSTLVRDFFGPGHELSAIHFFTAFAHHRDQNYPGTIQRHETLIAALETTGVEVHMGRLKSWRRRPEEKETDVAIAMKLVELFIREQADTVVLVSGDTDFLPAIRTAKALFPQKTVCVCAPWDRVNRELEQAADLHTKLTIKQYKKHQFSNPVINSDGKEIHRPASW